MIALLLAAGLLGLGGLEAAVAPDQILPVVYLDEPLIVQITPGTSGVHDILFSLTPAGKTETQTTVLEREILEAGASRWFTVPFMDKQAGPYICRIRLDAAAAPVSFEGQFTRIERPQLAVPLPVFADVSNAAPDSAGVLALAGIRTVRLPQDHPQWDAWIDELKRWDLDLIPISTVEDAPGLGDGLSLRFSCSELAGWHLSPAPAAGPLGNPPAIRCNLMPLWRVQYDSLGPLIDSAPQHVLLEGSMPPARILELDTLWARAHYQDAATIGWFLPRDEATAAQPFALIKILITAWSAGVDSFGFDSAYVDPATVPALVPPLQGWSPWLHDGEYVGQLTGLDGVTAHVFRMSGQWLLAGWTDDGSVQQIDPKSFTRDSQLIGRDEYFRETPQEGPWVLGAAPRYLSGTEFDIVRNILDRQIHAAVAGFGALEESARFVPPMLQEYLAAMAQEKRISPDRKRYIALLTLFPELEQRWHSGRIPGEIAKSLLAHLRGLALALAALEEFSGDPFLEPLQETLARCGEYQSVYLTNSSGDAQNKKRGDWLLNEVRALSEKADWLSSHGRPIEGSAVALCAEWRARALDFATKAGPLSDRSLAEVLGLPAADGAAPAVEPDQPRASKKITHTVKSGDTFDRICKQYGVPLEDFLKWNKVQANKTLRIGDTYVVYAPVKDTAEPAQPAEPPPAAATTAPAPEEPAAAAAQIHTVKRGDNPSIIAGKYKISLDNLLKWNKLTKRSVLNIGDKLVVSPPEN